MLQLRLTQIRANPWNCNVLGDQEKQKLKQRMSEDGPEKTPPVVVRKIKDSYELVDGEQRWTIAKELNWETINAIEREADDIQTRTLCVSYNRWRGHLNWFKLYDIVKKDQDTGINLKEAYQNALSNKEIEWLLSLENLIFEARLTLEEALKKYPEITLEQLYLLSLFPASQQESLVEKFKTPVASQALLQILNPILAKNQTTHHNQNLKYYPEKATNPLLSDLTAHRLDAHTEQDHNIQTNIPTNLDPNNRWELTLNNPLSRTDANTGQTSDGGEAQWQHARLIELSYNCECGHHYRVNFKNFTVVIQKQNLLFEHIDLKPRVFQVHCKKCASDQEFIIDYDEQDTKQIFCRRCKPPREGILDANTREVTWFS
ncbi:ParB N-terminal domain-containing protein [Candidatus Bathycorpusculum sp.]|uniref:ParB/RepB/Spo0J family partition protein n=1 Tax=Candidatus Bathycorpusculum sp. TaxID=2994959 RepID=UPI002837D7A5|nr:ParB N-terminal domain-containing protein [Candidatus Termitimicrobium sp.]MCL2686141.1 ParB N-terminal domain-containing protein [Candidatus Termitimicrobium sp.]